MARCKRKFTVGNGKYFSKNILPLILGGFICGICNGLVGTGGGVIPVLLLSRIAKDEQGQRAVYASALAIMLPLSCLTLSRYLMSGALGEGVAYALNGKILLGAMIGGVGGAILLRRLKSKQLAVLFSALTLLSGVLMIVR